MGVTPAYRACITVLHRSSAAPGPL